MNPLLRRRSVTILVAVHSSNTRLGAPAAFVGTFEDGAINQAGLNCRLDLAGCLVF